MIFNGPQRAEGEALFKIRHLARQQGISAQRISELEAMLALLEGAASHAVIALHLAAIREIDGASSDRLSRQARDLHALNTVAKAVLLGGLPR